MHVHVIMHDLPYLPRYTITAQQLCINECSSSHECSCDSTKIPILIIKSTNKDAKHVIILTLMLNMGKLDLIRTKHVIKTKQKK